MKRLLIAVAVLAIFSTPHVPVAHAAQGDVIRNKLDVGRTFVALGADGVTPAIAETVITFSQNKNGTITGSATSYTITSGKTLRIQAICPSFTAGAAANRVRCCPPPQHRRGVRGRIRAPRARRGAGPGVRHRRCLRGRCVRRVCGVPRWLGDLGQRHEGDLSHGECRCRVRAANRQPRCIRVLRRIKHGDHVECPEVFPPLGRDGESCACELHHRERGEHRAGNGWARLPWAHGGSPSHRVRASREGHHPDRRAPPGRHDHRGRHGVHGGRSGRFRRPRTCSSSPERPPPPSPIEGTITAPPRTSPR
jgi:hypothetical protein